MDPNERQIEASDDEPSQRSEKMHSQFNDDGGIYAHAKSLKEMESACVPGQFGEVVLLADNTPAKPLQAGISEIAEAQPEPPKTQAEWAARLEEFAKSRRATPTLDGNAIQLADNWQDGYGGNKCQLHGEGADYAIEHRKQVDTRTGQLISQQDVRIPSNRPVDIPLPEEVIPFQPGDEVQVAGNLQIKGSNDKIPYHATVGKLPDGRVSLNGEYWNEAHKEWVAFQATGGKRNSWGQVPELPPPNPPTTNTGDSGF